MNDIKITCINPLCDDETDHLWVNIKKNTFHCWKCEFSGKVMDNKDILNALKKVKYIKPATYTVSNSKDLINPEEFKPLESLRDDHEAIKYIKSRNVSLDLCTKIGGMYSPIGKLYGRVVFPIKNTNIIVGWQGRSVYDRKPKYLIFGKKSLGMYNMLELKEYKNFIIIFEGIFDVLKVPNNGISILGKKISDVQLRMLSTFLKVKTVFVMLDSDANKEEIILSNQLNHHFRSIPIQLKSGDPGDLSENEILQLCLDQMK